MIFPMKMKRDFFLLILLPFFFFKKELNSIVWHTDNDDLLEKLITDISHLLNFLSLQQYRIERLHHHFFKNLYTVVIQTRQLIHFVRKLYGFKWSLKRVIFGNQKAFFFLCLTLGRCRWCCTTAAAVPVFH